MKLRHQYNQLEDFLQDDSFVDWVLSEDGVANAFWHQWLLEHPDQEELARTAIGLIKNLHAVEQQFTPNNTMEDTWAKIKLETIDDKSPTIKSKSRWLTWLKYAASFMILVTLSVLFYKAGNKQVVLENDTIEWVLKENMDVRPKLIQLSDGSAVTLEPFSSIKYPKKFMGEKRVVFLEGEAFFETERDTTKPFLIYSNEILTRVLGTSFTIKAFEENNEIEVLVKTGKVAVYARTKSNQVEQKMLAVKSDQIQYIPMPNKRVEITRNQKAIFNKKKKELIKTIAAFPLLKKNIDQPTPYYQFENASLTTVFKAMEKAYGIKINFDQKILKDCTISTALTDLPMLEKLEIICELHACTFLEKDGQIFLEGKGCI